MNQITWSHLLELALPAPIQRAALVVVLGCCWDSSLEKQFGKVAGNHRKDVTSYGWLVLLRVYREVDNGKCILCLDNSFL